VGRGLQQRHWPGDALTERRRTARRRDTPAIGAHGLGVGALGVGEEDCEDRLEADVPVEGVVPFGDGTQDLLPLAGREDRIDAQRDHLDGGDIRDVCGVARLHRRQCIGRWVGDQIVALHAGAKRQDERRGGEDSQKHGRAP
jgi:hypothetical protein